LGAFIHLAELIGKEKLQRTSVCQTLEEGKRESSHVSAERSLESNAFLTPLLVSGKDFQISLSMTLCMYLALAYLNPNY